MSTDIRSNATILSSSQAQNVPFKTDYISGLTETLPGVYGVTAMHRASETTPVISDRTPLEMPDLHILGKGLVHGDTNDFRIKAEFEVFRSSSLYLDETEYLLRYLVDQYQEAHEHIEADTDQVMTIGAIQQALASVSKRIEDPEEIAVFDPDDFPLR